MIDATLLPGRQATMADAFQEYSLRRRPPVTKNNGPTGSRPTYPAIGPSNEYDIGDSP